VDLQQSIAPETSVSPSTSASQLAVLPSPIHGRGVFACRTFAPGDEVYSSNEYQVFSEPRLGSMERSIGQHVLEQIVFRWVNHSCAANARVVFRSNVVSLVAISPIRSGEEICCDYRRTESLIPVPFICNCGNCCGVWIGGAP